MKNNHYIPRRLAVLLLVVAVMLSLVPAAFAAQRLDYESIDELNYLASLLSEMDQSELEKFEAVLETGEYSGSVKDLINLTQNLDCFEFYSGITSEEELGRMYIQEFDAIRIYGGPESAPSTVFWPGLPMGR